MAMKTVPCHCVCKWRVFANPVTYKQNGGPGKLNWYKKKVKG